MTVAPTHTQDPNGTTYHAGGAGFAKQAPNHTFSPDLHGITGTFIPEIWGSRLIQDLESDLVFGALTNRTYEGTLRGPGDVVKIPHIISDSIHVQGGTLGLSPNGKPVPGDGNGENSGAAYATFDHFDRPSNDFLEMRIDQGRTWGFEVDNLHQMQTQGIALMQNLTAQSARALAESVDKHIVKTIKSAVKGKDLNWGDINLHGKVMTLDLTPEDEKTSKSSKTPADSLSKFYEQLLVAQTELNIRNVPTAGRVLVIGPQEYADLLRDERFIQAHRMGDSTSIMRTGIVGTILGMPVRVSNSIGRHLDYEPGKNPHYDGVPFVRAPHSETRGIYGVLMNSECVSFAHTLSDLEAFRPEKKFTDAVKGRMIFGTKVIRPEQMVVFGDLKELGVEAPAEPEVPKKA